MIINDDLLIAGNIQCSTLDTTLRELTDGLVEACERISGLTDKLGDLSDKYVALADKYNGAAEVINDISERLFALEKNYDPTLIKGGENK